MDATKVKTAEILSDMKELKKQLIYWQNRESQLEQQRRAAHARIAALEAKIGTLADLPAHYAALEDQ